MATIVYVESGGQLVDITDLPRAVKVRCDGCGEFVPDYDIATANVNVMRAGVPLGQKFLEGHADHILAKAAELLASLGAELGA